GKILIGGSFTSIGGQSVPRIARLNQDGTVDMNFFGSANNTVYSIVAQSDGKILVGGNFTQMSGQTRNGVARLNPNGTIDANFIPSPMADGGVYSIGVQSDGKLWVVGSFQFFGGLSRNRIARLSNNTAALQDLSVTRTTVEWTLNGSMPDFHRTTFE